MKLTKREREIVASLVAGARLRCYGRYSHTYQIDPTDLFPISGGQYVNEATLLRMKASGILRIGDVGGRNGYLPTEEAVKAVKPPAE